MRSSVAVILCLFCFVCVSATSSVAFFAVVWCLRSAVHGFPVYLHLYLLTGKCKDAYFNILFI